MKKGGSKLEALFKELDGDIEEINEARKKDGQFPVPKSEVRLLGQMSLLANEKVSLLLTLAQTADMDALLKMDHVVKEALKKLLRERGLLYDEDSYLIWIPKGAKFEGRFDFKNVTVKALDPESALVSKAVKAPEKNRQLIREAIASGEFGSLVERIEAEGGDLGYFAKE